jgi:hypothetical protein
MSRIVMVSELRSESVNVADTWYDSFDAQGLLHASNPQVGFEPITPVFERTKTTFCMWEFAAYAFRISLETKYMLIILYVLCIYKKSDYIVINLFRKKFNLFIHYVSPLLLLYAAVAS